MASSLEQNLSSFIGNLMFQLISATTTLAAINEELLAVKTELTNLKAQQKPE